MKTPIRTILSGVVSLFLAVPALGLEYSLQPSVEANATHNDNIRLTPKDPLSLQGREVKTAVDSQMAGATWQAKLRLDLNFNHYNRSEFDSDDQIANLTLNKVTERQNFGLLANLTRDSTRTSETDTTGVVGLTAVRRVSSYIKPYWSYYVTPRNQVSLSVYMNRVNYTNKASGSSYSNYTSNAAQLGWTTAVNEDLSLQLQVTASRYKPEDIYIPVFSETEYILNGFLGMTQPQAIYNAYVGNAISTSTTKDVETLVGGNYQFSKQLSTKVMVGLTRSSVTYSTIDQSFDQYDTSNICSPDHKDAVYLGGNNPCNYPNTSTRFFSSDISVDWQGERSTASLEYSVANEPTGQGSEIKSSKINLDLKYDLTERSSAQLKTLYGQERLVNSSALASLPYSLNRDFINTTALYKIRLTENWWLNTRYTYHWQDRQAVGSAAKSNAVFLGVIYKPTKSIWSR